MKFNKINHIVVFGGSQIVIEFLKLLKKKKINFHYFTNKRQLKDNLTNNLNLKDNLKKNNIRFFETEDINKNKLIKKIFTLFFINTFSKIIPFLSFLIECIESLINLLFTKS